MVNMHIPMRLIQKILKLTEDYRNYVKQAIVEKLVRDGVDPKELET